MLQGKNIVVIGGTSGLGLSAAEAFLRQGAAIVVTGKDIESCDNAKTRLGKEARIMLLDATQEGTTQKAIEVLERDFGPLHGLYHVAGGSGRSFGDGPLHEMTLSGWNKTLELNLTSVMLSNQAVIGHWLAHGRAGVILNLGSVLATSPAPAFFATHAYAAAKSALIGFSKSVAAFYAVNNIRVNVIAPSLVNTPMARRAVSDESIKKYIRTKQPLDGGRVAHPQDLDGAALFLMSDASSFLTGQLISVDGGWTVSEGQVMGRE